MLFAKKTASEKRAAFRAAIDSGALQQMPGAFSPLVAVLVQEKGFDGVYISGAALSADLALPDIGLTTLQEVTARGHQIARATDLPALIDLDTGFGEAMNAARSIQEIEDAGSCRMPPGRSAEPQALRSSRQQGADPRHGTWFRRFAPRRMRSAIRISS